MTNLRRFRLFGASALVLVLATMPVARAVGAEDAGIMEKIASAKTPADYEALAVHFDKQAADARAQAERHKTMAEDYRRAGGPAAKAQLPEHCEGLVTYYNGVAKEYAAMAAGYRQMAKEAAAK
jgi:hypothetical protein